MTELLQIFLTGLAASRVAYMVAREDGPAFVFIRWRSWLAARGGWVADLFDCPYCLSVWLVPVFWLLPDIITAVVASMWLAFAAVAIMEKLTNDN
ncbi:MAG: hypothetical protein KDD89_00940 [Anaerolineales bacterium]|nr:hypothetical protein [Anaerolineales bacterium]